ncbi:unnamed protein product [Periconia digitata]|uniref:DUF7730 domain-containing protein n=1 Tax=Periconia digitata TaxID=1303443 RepID=A0A9W4U6L5_9PLEO|nr:unnamed protein product [Periconia digitata]
MTTYRRPRKFRWYTMPVNSKRLPSVAKLVSDWLDGMKPRMWVSAWSNQDWPFLARALIFCLYYPIGLPLTAVILALGLVYCILISAGYCLYCGMELCGVCCGWSPRGLLYHLRWLICYRWRKKRHGTAAEPKNQVKTVSVRRRERNLTLVLGTTMIREMDAVRSDEKGPLDPTELEMGLGWVRKDKKDGTSQKPPIHQTTIDQMKTCQLWRLPPEIRALIWMFVVGGGHVHIVRTQKRLVGVYCPAKDPTDPLHKDLCVSKMDKYDYYHDPSPWPMDRRPLSLLLTCRQIYSEAINLLYSTNTFAFSGPKTCELFFTHLLAPRRPYVSSIHLAPVFDNLDTPDRYNVRRGYSIRDPLRYWSTVISYLQAKPWNLTLTHITITPILNSWDAEAMNTPWDTKIIESIISKANRFGVIWKGSTTLTWCTAKPPVPIQSWGDVHWEDEKRLPSPLHMTLRRYDYRPKTQLMAFFCPMTVQCLHCENYTVIRRNTRDIAEVTVLEREESFVLSAEPSGPNASLESWVPVRKRYIMGHAPCSGWIEFQYDARETKKWTVTAGAREITEDEAKMNVLQQCHKMVVGICVQRLWDWTESGGNGTMMDQETLDRVYEQADPELLKGGLE